MRITDNIKAVPFHVYTSLSTNEMVVLGLPAPSNSCPPMTDPSYGFAQEITNSNPLVYIWGD